jgi:hypothetical protein
MDEPVRYDIATAGDETQGVPELSRSVIEGAMERLDNRNNEES